MGRKYLPWYPGAIYHITTRGNRKEPIFREKEDYLIYLKMLKEALKRFNGTLHCYCLMTNHVHLIVETKEFKTSEIMRRLNWFYVRYFNTKYNFNGHLFQGRYYAELIDRDDYLLEASRYVHLNPLRASIVRRPEEYQWSSYGMFIGFRREKLIVTDRILSYFPPEKSKVLYRNFVENYFNTTVNDEII